MPFTVWIILCACVYSMNFEYYSSNQMNKWILCGGFGRVTTLVNIYILPLAVSSIRNPSHSVRLDPLFGKWKWKKPQKQRERETKPKIKSFPSKNKRSTHICVNLVSCVWCTSLKKKTSEKTIIRLLANVYYEFPFL